MYFGSDEDLAGQAVGQRITSAGGGKTLCVIQAAGFGRAGGPLRRREEDHARTPRTSRSTAPTSRRSRPPSAAKLQEDPSITHVVTLGAPIALAALNSKADSGSEAKIATFDLNPDAAQAIQDGKILFSVDQQPYVQGYMAVTSLWLNLTNGNDIGGGKPVLTGPSFVDQTNIDQILPYSAEQHALVPQPGGAGATGSPRSAHTWSRP